MRGILVQVGENPMEYEFDGLKEMQKAVGGYIESVSWLFNDSPAVYVNENGKLDGSEPNRAISYGGEVVDILFGPILCAGVDFESGETRGLTDEELDRAMRYFTEESPAESGIAAVVSILAGRNR